MQPGLAVISLPVAALVTVEIAERIRQVGPNKQGAKGSYTVYRVAE